MLWRKTAGGALRPLDPDGPSRVGLGRPLLFALGISGSVHRAVAASDSHLHRAARGRGAHATRQISCVYVSGFVAVVLCPGLFRNEAGRKLARARKIFPQVRRGDYGGVGGGRGVVCVESLAGKNQLSAWSAGLANCDPTICQLPCRFITTSI